MDDSDRYRTALQASLLTEGWEEAWDYGRLRTWVQRNREQLRARARATLGRAASTHEDHFANAIESFSPRSKFDLPMTEAIFRPLFDEVVECARAAGLRPIREVELVTSTSISVTPFARPTTGTHQLFIGLGTSTFCNYWAKAYTAIVKAIAAGGPPYKSVTTPDDLRTHLSTDPRGLVLAIRLALYYGAMETLMGFGEVDQPPDYAAYRAQLLVAMEVFALSHEYAHFVAEERKLEFADESGEASASELEFFCDAMGLQISRDWGSKNNNWLAFTGVGGLVFFRAVDISEGCAAELVSSTPNLHSSPRPRRYGEQDSHPPNGDRAIQLITNAVNGTCSDQRAAVAAFLTEYDLICTTIGTYVLNIVRETATAGAVGSSAQDPDSDPNTLG